MKCQSEITRALNKSGLGGLARREALYAIRPTVERIEREREAATAKRVPPCEWAEDDDGVWQTDCGEAHQFTDGGPVENSQRFCGYCGGKLKPKPYVESR